MDLLYLGRFRDVIYSLAARSYASLHLRNDSFSMQIASRNVFYFLSAIHALMLETCQST